MVVAFCPCACTDWATDDPYSPLLPQSRSVKVTITWIVDDTCFQKMKPNRAFALSSGQNQQGQFWRWKGSAGV
jgi:hypothetical protein